MSEITKTDELIMSKIYLIRGQKVMLDRDIAELYGTETKRVNEQVSRNPERFPENFMFQLTPEETQNLRSHFATANMSSKSRVMPRVFTEHGVLMLSNVLKSDSAIKMSIQIIEVFVKMREMLLTHKDILIQLERVEKTQGMHAKDIGHLYEVINHLMDEKKKPKPRTRIGFKTKGTENE